MEKVTRRLKKVIPLSSYCLKKYDNMDLALTSKRTGEIRLVRVRRIIGGKMNQKRIVELLTGEGSPSDYKQWTGFGFVNTEDFRTGEPLTTPTVVVWSAKRGAELPFDKLADVVRRPADFLGRGLSAIEISVEVEEEYLGPGEIAAKDEEDDDDSDVPF